jgi:hypothetical protein
MSRDSPGSGPQNEVRSPSIKKAQLDLIEHGYAIISETDIDGMAKTRQHMMIYFSRNILKRPGNDTPPDRERARDVILYEWHPSLGSVRLVESNDVVVRRPNGDRDEYARVRLLESPIGYQFAATILSLIPACWRQRSGALGVNFLRTFTDVVTKPHQERSGQFIGIWVIDKVGEGAETYLYDYFTPGRLVLKRLLRPGDLIILNDELFLHGAAPLEPVDGRAQRDALNFTIHFPGFCRPRKPAILASRTN